MQEAYASGLLDDEATWVRMLQDRNMTSHTYDEVLADQIFFRIRLYVPVIREAYNKLSSMVVEK